MTAPFDWAPPEFGPATGIGPSTGAPGAARAPGTQPYRPDTVADGWATEELEVRAAAVRGVSHRVLGVPRQDEFALAVHPGSGSVIAVVADGLSSAALSHMGATVVCRTVVDYLLRALDTAGSAGDGAGGDGGSGDGVDWGDLLRCAGWSLVEYANRQLGEAEPQRAEALLATTVVVALVGPDGSAWLVRVGDSAAWTLRDGVWTPLFPALTRPEDELLPDGVAALPRVPNAIEPVTVALDASDVLVLGTDGFAEPLGDGKGEVGRLFAEALETPPPMARLAWLLDFTGPWDDDRTLIGLWRTASRSRTGEAEEAKADG
ncbi:protein phosphatase 2C domain-containing protein [Actinoplanes sp. NPDC051851]|uniref:protein phosphatase 2C domain-containing protein n=1 Tax=Actinoplanes sp. NPDC051851 TaxID=3154753 RepID=UPI00343669AC